MSRTIRVNDKSDVGHSLGKHALHKTETGRQTLTCLKLITCGGKHILTHAHTHTRTCTHTRGLVDMLRQRWEFDWAKLCFRKEKARFAEKISKSDLICDLLEELPRGDLRVFVLHCCTMCSKEIERYTAVMYMTDLH